jgi:hypothetical protein
VEAQVLLEYQWPYLLTFFPPSEELERTAREKGAITRKRAVASAETLLRLALAYGFCGLTLRQTAAWAQVIGIAHLSDVALLKRLRASDVWLGYLLGLKLAENAPPPPTQPSHRLRLFDATSISRPGSSGTDWRVHLGFDLSSLSIDHIELTDVKGGETLTRFTLSSGEIAVGDRGYAHRKGLHSVRVAGADFIVRLNWQNLPLKNAQGTSFDLLGFLRRLPEAQSGECAVIVTGSDQDAVPDMPARLVAVRKSEAAAEASRAKVLRERAKKGRAVDPRTLETAGYVFVLTSLPAEVLSASQVLETYRFRWQVELAFKRLKSLLYLGHLPARDPPLARSFLFSKLLAALLLEDFTDRLLAFFPWGYRLA